MNQTTQITPSNHPSSFEGVVNSTPSTKIQSLIDWYVPTFWFHSEEEYFSMPIYTYINIFSKECDKNIFELLDDTCKYGIKNTLQIIANVVEHTFDNTLVTDIIYFVFFPYSLNSFLCSKTEDWICMEKIVIRFKCKIENIKLGEDPTYVLFPKTKPRWFSWNSSNEIDISEYGKINVYISKYSHKLFPKPGKYWSGLCIKHICDKGLICNNLTIIRYNKSNPIFDAISLFKNYTNQFYRKELSTGEQFPY